MALVRPVTFVARECLAVLECPAGQRHPAAQGALRSGNALRSSLTSCRSHCRARSQYLRERCSVDELPARLDQTAQPFESTGLELQDRSAPADVRYILTSAFSSQSAIVARSIARSSAPQSAAASWGPICGFSVSQIPCEMLAGRATAVYHVFGAPATLRAPSSWLAKVET
jgi:hypothetical protein